MKQIHHITRQELLFAELPGAKRFTEGQSARAFRSKEGRGWITAMPADGPPFEMVAFVHENHRLAGLVSRVRGGQRRMGEDELRAELGGAWATSWTLPKLAKIGLAVVDYAADQVRFSPADPRAARFVNESRQKVSPRGYKIQRLIEAFLPVRDPRRSHVKVTDNRRLELADVLDTCWEIQAEDLLDDRRWIRLVSRWTVLQIINLEAAPA
jgi:hypothetical protein